jgi:hypothetical protein
VGILQQPEQKPRQRLSQLSRLKVHLRLLQIAGKIYRLVTLRPSTHVAFSTNYYHHTWHLVSNRTGSQLLARLLWGLSYQRQAGTMILIHDQHLLPTPFEAERSDPFLLIPSHLTSIDPEAFRLLKSRLRHLGHPCTTIRWLTFGLDRALQAEQQDTLQLRRQYAWDRLGDKDHRYLWKQERMGRSGGFIFYAAPPLVLRLQALILQGLRVRMGSYLTEMSYHFLAEESSRRSWADGEVQIFADYQERVAAAMQARQELLPQPNQPVISETLQEDISRRRDQIKILKRRCRHRSRQK